MPRQSVGFDAAFRRHLPDAQRRAVLDALRTEIDPDVTLGEVVDAATALGFGAELGELSLAELADALAEVDAEPGAAGTAPQGPMEADEAEYAEDDEEEPEEAEEPVTKGPRGPGAGRGPAPTVAATKGAAAKKKSSKLREAAAKKKAGRGRVELATKVSAARAQSRRVEEREDEDEDEGEDRMSLAQAEELLLPLVTKLGKATMEQLERATKLGRRKLRFHVGQLVKHAVLARHGMGRGTYYTLA